MKKRNKYKTIRYTDEEKMMFDESLESFMLRLKRNPVPEDGQSWKKIIHDTQKNEPKSLFKERNKHEKN